MDLDDALRKISALGLKYVELSADPGSHLEPKLRDGVPPLRTKELLEEFDLKAAALAVYSDFAACGAELDAMLDFVGRAITWCRELDASILRIFASTLYIGSYVADGLLDRTVGNIKRVLPIAEENGVRLALENHCALTETGEDVVRLIEAVDSPWLGAVYDPSNFIYMPPDMILGFDKPWRDDDYYPVRSAPVRVDPVGAGRQIAPHIIYCHLKDIIYVRSDRLNGFGFVEVGAGIVDWAGVIRVLREIDYEGFLSLEYLTPDDPVRGTREGLANLRQVMAQSV
jgi:sugar phosphate isomerase/epimerase